MQELLSLGAVLGALAIGVVTPGPSFLYSTLKVVGGLYLCYLGHRIFAGARQPLLITNDRGAAAARSIRASLWLGLTTQLSNPKTAVVYASVFAAFLPGHLSVHLAVGLVTIVFALETCWYAFVATMLSTAVPRRAYVGCKVFVDRAAGIVMVGLGLKLIASARKAVAA